MGTEVRDRLIGSTISLVAKNGVAGTGMTELVQESHVSRRTLYVNFPDGKAELVTEATRTAGRVMGGIVKGLMSKPDSTAPILEFAEIWKRVLESSDFTSGCPIVAAALGRRDAPDAADAAGQVFTDWTTMLSQWAQGHNVPQETANDLATSIVAGIEGAVIMSLATRSVEPLDRVTRQMTVLADLTMERHANK